MIKSSKVLNEEAIDDTNEEVAPAIASENYYAEVLFDYLEIFYKKALIDQADTHEYLYNLQKKVEKGLINKDTLK